MRGCAALGSNCRAAPHTAAGLHRHTAPGRGSSTLPAARPSLGSNGSSGNGSSGSSTASSTVAAHAAHSGVHGPASSGVRRRPDAGPNSRRMHARRATAAAAAAGSNGVPQQQQQPDTCFVSIAELRELCSKALSTQGYSPAEVAVLLEVLMYAQLRGNNQGIIKITTNGLARAPDAPPFAVEHETPLSARINGHGQAGMLVLHAAMDMALSKAAASGAGVVGTCGTATSTGALSFYADAIARRGLIGLVLAQSPEFVAPHGARQALFGTNPIAVGIPSQSGPVVMDMATAAYAWFGLLEAQTAGRPIPGDVALNAAGEATTDPSEVLSGGAIRVFDRSHKGSNLALMVELLAGPLVGAAVADKLQARNWGNLVVVLDPALLGDPATIRARTQVVLDRVKGAQRLPGVAEILLPSERGNRVAAQHTASGMLPIEANLLTNLRAMAAKAGSTPPLPAAAAAAAAPAVAAAAAVAATLGSGSSSNGAAPHTAVPAAAAVGLKLETLLLHPAPGSVVDPFDASGAPLYQTATFGQPGATDCGPYDYTRSGNPTRTQLEEQWAALEGGCRALAYTSGMAALAVVTKLVPAGGHIVAGDDLYGGTSRLLSRVVPNSGVTVSNVDMTDLGAVAAAIIPNRTALVMVESPTNPRMQVCDIAAIVRLAHAAGALVCVDNSFLTPLYQRPLDLGADISMTSGTKYVGGHGDTTLGLLAVRDAELGQRLYFLQNSEGAGLAPMDCWLALRGLKTMALRMERSVANAAALAAFLSRHPLVKRLNYAALPSHPGADIHARQATSGGAVLSFETGDLEVSRTIVEATKLFKVTVSFGNVISLISLPCFMSHASIPAEVRAARGLPDDLVRISAGIEDAGDLIADLSAAMELAQQQLHARGGGGAAGAAPAGSSSNGSSSAGNGSSSSHGGDRLQQLEARVVQLEAQLAAQNQQQQQQIQQQHAANGLTTRS